MTLHEILDFHSGPEGEEELRAMLAAGADPNQPDGAHAETPLHVATRRYRPGAVTILLDAGALLDAKTAGGKTAYAHAVRRGFTELTDIFNQRGADTGLGDADRFAVALVSGRLDEAREMLAANPGLARTGNPEEDRLLADVAGRNPTEPVELLIGAGADLAATAVDDGTALHQTAWFGQPQNARLLIDAGAPLEVFDTTHESSPLGWAVHGSRYSGGADERQDVYVELAAMLLDAGSKLHYPHDPDGDAYRTRLLDDASPRVREVLARHLADSSD